MVNNKENQNKVIEAADKNLRNKLGKISDYSTANLEKKLTGYGDFSYKFINGVLNGAVKKIPIEFIIAVHFAYGISFDELLLQDYKPSVEDLLTQNDHNNHLIREWLITPKQG